MVKFKLRLQLDLVVPFCKFFGFLVAQSSFTELSIAAVVSSFIVSDANTPNNIFITSISRQDK
jgi:hypothetical protein